MVEAFIALGVAANIAQFIGLSVATISTGKEIYDSIHGSRKAYDELEEMVTSMKSLHNGVIQALRGVQSSLGELAALIRPLSEAEIIIFKLAERCEPISKEIIQILEDLKVPQQARGLNRAIQTAKQTLRHTRQKKDIKELQERLFALDSQLKGTLSLLLQVQNHSKVIKAIQGLDQRQDQLEAHSVKRFDDLRKEILDAISAKDHTPPIQVVAIDQLAPKLGAFTTIAKEMEKQQMVLESLMFDSMKEREEIIKESYVSTLDWIFTSHKTPLLKWLTTEGGIFWIGGKAGSGKSTLMKHIHSHKKTLTALEQWASPQQLITASYFFWNAGLPLQKSDKGLLQSLLYQMLAASPGLMPEICAKRFPKEPWSRDELFEALKQISTDPKFSLKFCFFVDGLDEFDGDDEKIIGLLQALSSSSNIKVCLSSRPWTAFLDAFGSSKWKLTMEDLTKGDMEIYVRSELNENRSFGSFAQKDRRSIEEQIVDKAQGVWLWVYLVVRDILRDIKGEEDFEHLQSRIDSFPAELELYFADTLNRIDRHFLEETAEIFLLAITAVGPVSVFAFEYLDRERKDTEYAINMHISPISSSSAHDAFRTWRKRLNSRCKDLLEVNTRDSETTFLKYKVDFLHRTVRDFLQDNYQPEVRKRASRFNPVGSLCKIMVALVKGLDSSQGLHLHLDQFFSLVDEMMYYARELELRSNTASTQLLEELDSVCKAHTKGSKNHWTNARDPASPVTRFKEYGECSFLALAIQSQLHLYVKEKLYQNPGLVSSKRCRPLLDYALRPKRVTPADLPYKLQYQDTTVDVRTVKLLLSYGADPNEQIRIYDHQTPWSLYLSSCYANCQNVSDYVRNSWEEVILSLINHRADASAQCENPNKIVLQKIGETAKYKQDVLTKSEPRYFTVHEILQSVLPNDAAVRLESHMSSVTHQETGWVSSIWKRFFWGP